MSEPRSFIAGLRWWGLPRQLLDADCTDGQSMQDFNPPGGNAASRNTGPHFGWGIDFVHDFMHTGQFGSIIP